MTIERLRIPARDGHELAGTLYRPPDRDLEQVTIIHSATAVPRRFYEAFARYLAHHGMSVVSYDYRGIGGSKPESLRGFQARAEDWVLQDMAGVLDWVQAELTPRRIGHVGHSFGGQTPGLLPNGHLIDAMVTVSAQTGYWNMQRGFERWNVGFHVHVTLPLFARVLGYVPWSAFSKAEDLPRGVALQWARWCRSPGYLFDDPGLPLDRYADFSTPILAYSVEDDDWGTAPAVDAVHRHYPDVTRKHIDPKRAGLPPVGHFGFFRSRSEPLSDCR